ncbi:MAG: PAS domain-containing sensor histidine kinase [Myxococcales bacterium]|nr:PAS domain-containing sensor histidine kinase [Myxococcales bacterium]
MAIGKRCADRGQQSIDDAPVDPGSPHWTDDGPLALFCLRPERERDRCSASAPLAVFEVAITASAPLPGRNRPLPLVLYLFREGLVATPSVGNASSTAAALDHATRAAIASRFGHFAAGCLAPAVVWAVTFAWAVPDLAPLIVLALAAEAGALGAGWWVLDRRGAAVAVIATVCATTLLAGIATTVTFVAVGAGGEVLGFALFTFCALAAVVFPWGWRREAGFTAGALLLLGIAAPSLRFALVDHEVVPIVVIAAVLCLAIAEGHARAFHAELRRRWGEDRAQRELAASRDTYRDITENARDFIWASDLDGRITYINEAGARILGFAPADLVGKNVDQYAVGITTYGNPADMRARLAAGATLPPTVAEWRTTKGRIWVEAVAYAVHDAAGRTIGFRGISRDITEHWLAAAALREREEQLRRMALRQAAIREEERKRLGFDLHEGVCQELVGIGILIEAARRSGVSPPAADMLARAQGYLGTVGEHLRLLARELRPLQLPDLGLGECLRILAKGLESAETSIAVGVPADLPRLAENIEIGVYRIAQEALANAVRHAGGARVTLSLEAAAGTLALEVRDDGRGFERGSLPAAAVGLVAMEERAAAIGGRLRIRSAPGNGTTVRLECPLAG